jgi:uncharacterized repeat protein (TIGR04138 family)
MKTPIVERRNQPRLQFDPHAYVFVQEALKTAQELVGRQITSDRMDDDSHHISGQELLEGVRVLGLRRYGLLAPDVFRHWGLNTTDDFGRVVFEMIERGQMRKSDRDQLSDFHNLFTIDESFAHDYQIDVSKAFRPL